MNNKILSLLGIVAATVGITTGATSAQASTLGPGALSIQTDGGIFFSNNGVDFTVGNTNAQSPGVAGTGNVTTPPNPIENQAGVFGIIPGTLTTYPPFDNIDEVIEKLDGRQFTQTEILINDFELPFFVENNTFYDLTAGGTVAPTEFVLFDTDQDGEFGEGTGVGSELTGDFKFFTTGFTRIVEPDEPGTGPFNVIFEFEGFFQDMEGNFKDTPAEFALFNGVTNNNPEFLSVTGVAAGNDPFELQGDFEFQAGGDGRIGTLGRQVPEPGTIIGLTALAGLGLSSRLKRKAK